ncbi:MAG: hypothetical protein LBO66_12970 [Deltaproteobacteria bacterium]|jgi:hypothetical protein|nr:hypothetical protein [Deltaproteobacteria bacterium]
MLLFANAANLNLKAWRPAEAIDAPELALLLARVFSAALWIAAMGLN